MPKRTFTWVDGLVTKEMARQIKDAWFTDVVIRRQTAEEMVQSIRNLRDAGLKAWIFVLCPRAEYDFTSYFNNILAQNPVGDGYYVDDTQIIPETGGDVARYHEMVAKANEILGAYAPVIFEAVAGWNAAFTDEEVRSIYVKDFDYYANPWYNYLTAVWVNYETRGIYLWLFDLAPTIPLSQCEAIYEQAKALGCERICVWQWYFAGEVGHPSEGSSIVFRSELVEKITELNYDFLGRPAIPPALAPVVVVIAVLVPVALTCIFVYLAYKMRILR